MAKKWAKWASSLCAPFWCIIGLQCKNGNSLISIPFISALVSLTAPAGRNQPTIALSWEDWGRRLEKMAAITDRLLALAFEAVSTPHIDSECSVLHAACIEKDVSTCKTILSCSPSKLDTAIALEVRVPKGFKGMCNTDATVIDLVKGESGSSGLLQIIENAEKNTQRLSLMHEAAVKGSIRQIKRVLKLGEDIDKPSPFREDGEATPILLAAASNSCLVIRFLAENGANVDAKDRSRRGVLHYAAMGGNKETVLYLLRSGVPVDCKSTWGKSALHMAAVKGHAEIVAILIQNGADLHASTGFGDTALLLAAEEGHLECVKTLVQNGSNVNLSNMACYTPLHNAAKEGHVEVVSYLLRKGSHVNAASAKGETSLSLAVRKINNKEIVALLLSHGSSLNLSDRYGRTPLHYSTDNEVAELLFNKGADPHVEDFEGKTPLFLAALDGYEKVVEFLIEKGSNVNKGSDCGDTPLHEAAIRGHINIAQILLQHGANINARRVTGETPLFLAAIACKVKMKQLLTSLGADMNISTLEVEKV